MRYNENVTNKIYQYFTARVGLKKSTKGFYRGDCPYCGGHYTFGANFESNKTNCFKCPEGKTSTINVIKDRERLKTFRDVIEFLNLQADYGYVFRVEKTQHHKEVQHLTLPDHYHLITMGDTDMARAARYYWAQKRGFNLKRSEEAGIGYCDQGDYKGYIIIPYFVMGKLVYFTSRRYQGFGPKFKNPPEDQFGIGKTQVIYNQDALFMYDRVEIVESATNALTLGSTAVGLGGKDASLYQMYMMLKSPAQFFTLLLDPDAIGKSYQLALKLAEHKHVRVIHMPLGEDVNSYGKTKTRDLIRASKFLTYRELRGNYYDIRDYDKRPQYAREPR